MGRPQAMIDIAKLLEEAVEQDLEDIRAEIQREKEEFSEHLHDHNRYLRSLTLLEVCMAARLGQPATYSGAPVHLPIDVVVSLDKPAEAEPTQAQPEQSQLKPADVTELPASGEILLDDPEPVVEDDERSIEERIRDLLAKIGSRSARQIGAQIGVEKSVVYAALHGSKWFRMERGNDELPEHNRPWQLTASGER